MRGHCEHKPTKKTLSPPQTHTNLTYTFMKKTKRPLLIITLLSFTLSSCGVMFGGSKYSGTIMVKRSEEHTSELQSRENLVCRLLLEKKNTRCDKQPTPFRPPRLIIQYLGR